MGNLMLTTKRRLNQISFIQIDLKTSENWFQEYLEVRIKERKGIGEHESMFSTWNIWLCNPIALDTVKYRSRFKYNCNHINPWYWENYWQQLAHAQFHIQTPMHKRPRQTIIDLHMLSHIANRNWVLTDHWAEKENVRPMLPRRTRNKSTCHFGILCIWGYQAWVSTKLY